MLPILRRELIYFWYYFSVQLEQIFPYWVLGMVLGSAISVFAKDSIHKLFRSIQGKRLGALGVIPASALGIASPLCMYGTIPIAVSFSESGMEHDWLAAFMMSSILLNPQLIFYSMALGPKSRDTDPNPLVRLLKNLGRNLKATGPMFLLGVVLSALFQRYVPSDTMARLFGENEGFGVLMAATIGVPLYACGGGTIPLLQAWLMDGMSAGSAAAFMITGPATKITNLGAVKIVLGAKRFALYLAFTVMFALATGWIVNLAA